MKLWKLLRAELWHRKVNCALALVALAAAAALFVASPTLLRGYGEQSTERLERMHQETADELASMHADLERALGELRAQSDARLTTLRQATDAELAALQRETDAQLAKMRAEAQTALVDLDNKTKRVMRDLGFNLRIIHQATDLTQLHTNYVSPPMPETYVAKLAESPGITKIAHLVATLKQMVEWEGKPRLLVGFAPEATQAHAEKKSPMGFQIEPGKVFLGSLAAEGKRLGQKVEILGKSFEVAHLLEPHGNRDEDILIAMHLKDAQEVLNKPGLISEIQALGCKCETVNRVEEIQAQLEAVLPETRVLELRSQAIARETQRNLVTRHHDAALAAHAAHRQQILAQEKARHDAVLRQVAESQASILAQEQQRHGRLLEEERARQSKMLAQAEQHQAGILDLLALLTTLGMPLAVLASTIWTGFLAWSNVRERRAEIGLLRAIGKRSDQIASLFLLKAALLGLAGGVLGAAVGWVASQGLATWVFEASPAAFAPGWPLLALALVGAPAVSALASYLPTLRAITQDPARVLLEG